MMEALKVVEKVAGNIAPGRAPFLTKLT